ncbi:MAG: Na+:solute symporter, partial [Bacteroidota bacterium]
LVNDFYQRFINPQASQRQLVWAARLVTVLSAFLGLGLGLLLKDASQAFNLLLLLGAGTGLIYILRWFWWRINAMTEIVAMVVSLFIASYFTFAEHGLESWQTIVIGSLLTTIIWIVSAFLTQPTDDETLFNFYRKIKPGGNGWDVVIQKAQAKGVPLEKDAGQLPLEILCVLIGSITVYTALFATGNWIYGNTSLALTFSLVALGGGAFLFWAWKRLKTE